MTEPGVENFYRDESFRDSISTIKEDGKRNWIYPKKPNGKLYNYRTIVSIVLLVLLFGMPWLKINGNPFLMLNVIERKFVIFGQVFWPQDFHLFVMAMITFVVFIIVFTVIFGRVFCGWVCPQTIFMEMVFRKIEYWIEGDWKHQKKLDEQPWNQEKILKKGSKHILFWGISFAISNTFLAYIIGSDELLSIQLDNPMNHAGGLGAILIFTTVFYLVFSRFREQVCIAVCPYGRLQGVLLDRNSVVVTYDYQRGEKRGKWKGKKEVRHDVGKGDCIDCGQCVDVCPTGIDIRNGTQLECINCTACIDACDNVMEKVGLPKGLVRYDSEEGIANKREFKFTGRMKAYVALLVVLLVVFFGLLISRNDVETTILRTPGITYQIREDGRISNLYNIKVINKTNQEFDISLKIEGTDKGEIQLVGEGLKFSEGVAQGALFILMPKEELEGAKTKLEISVYSNGELIDETTTNFMGPAI